MTDHQKQVQRTAEFFATMPILTHAEVQLLPLGRRRDIQAREHELERIKNAANDAITAYDMLMRASQRAGERARRRREETERVVAEIKATPVAPDPEGRARLAALEADIATTRRTA